MKITVLSFGQIKDITGSSDLIFTDVNNSAQLLENLISKYPELSTLNFSIAVNKKIISEKTALSDNDVIALLPAFSGG
jgi:molybdopterin converting factor small subunit